MEASVPQRGVRCITISTRLVPHRGPLGAENRPIADSRCRLSIVDNDATRWAENELHGFVSRASFRERPLRAVPCPDVERLWVIWNGCDEPADHQQLASISVVHLSRNRH